MKKRVQYSALYQYLNDSGALESGDPAAIASAKRRYWSKVRSNWNKEKRKRCKSYTVLLEGQELRAVQRAAKEQQMSATRFIKAAALHVAKQDAMINKIVIGEIRQLLMNHYSAIEVSVQKNTANKTIGQDFLQSAYNLQLAVLKVLERNSDE